MMKLEMMKLMRLALFSPMHPLTTANDSGSEFILPVKRKGVSVFAVFFVEFDKY